MSSRLRPLTFGRYTLFSALGANPDHRENYQVHKSGPRLPATNTTADQTDYIVNYKDAVTGFLVNGTLPVDNAQGVHSLTDVPVFAMGPCQEVFGGTYIGLSHTSLVADCCVQESTTTSTSSSTWQLAWGSRGTRRRSNARKMFHQAYLYNMIRYFSKIFHKTLVTTIEVIDFLLARRILTRKIPQKIKKFENNLKIF